MNGEEAMSTGMGQMNEHAPIVHQFDLRKYRQTNLVVHCVCAILWLGGSILGLLAIIKNKGVSALYWFNFLIALSNVVLWIATYFLKLELGKDQKIYVCSDEVVYRRRRWISRRQGARYVQCHIKEVNRFKQSMKDEIIVWGKIEARYIGKDGKQTVMVRQRKRVTIPGVFEYMKGIWDTLGEMEKQVDIAMFEHQYVLN